MPAPNPVAYWPDVKATAIATGSMDQAAKLHGIAPATVRQRARREGWPVGRRVHDQAQQARAAADAQIVRASAGTVTHVTSASDAALAANADNSRRGRSALLRYGAAAAEHAASLDGDAQLAAAPSVASVAKVLATAGDWGQQQAQAVRVSIFGGQTVVSVASQDCEPTE